MAMQMPFGSAAPRRDSAIECLFKVLRHAPLPHRANELVEGLNLVINVLDKKALIELRRIVTERCSDKQRIVGLIDKRLAVDDSNAPA